MQWIDGERREEWETMLTAPLEGHQRPSERQLELEGADFMATLQMHQQQQGG